MISFQDTVAAFAAPLAKSGYRLTPTQTPVGGGTRDVRAVFPGPIVSNPIFAIPDVHLARGGADDPFLADHADQPQRLAAVLRAIQSFFVLHPLGAVALQLGDWFDVWRATGGDATQMTYAPTQNAAAYEEILDLDAQLGLAHLIGNHDASFVRALPDRRAGQPELFRLGFWLGDAVYALHGHQTDLPMPPNAASEEFIVAAATTIAEFVPGVTTLEAYIDRFGALAGVGHWLLEGCGLVRPDPGPQPRPADPTAPPGVQAPFVVRENADLLARLVGGVGRHGSAHGRAADLLIVGHSHAPCVAWSAAGGRPLVIVDAGAWVYNQANLLIVAGDTAAVFDVVRA